MYELSERCQKWIQTPQGLMEGMTRAMEDPFNELSNPDGCINLGAAENTLMLDLLSEKVF